MYDTIGKFNRKEKGKEKSISSVVVMELRAIMKVGTWVSSCCKLDTEEHPVPRVMPSQSYVGEDGTTFRDGGSSSNRRWLSMSFLALRPAGLRVDVGFLSAFLDWIHNNYTVTPKQKPPCF